MLRGIISLKVKQQSLTSHGSSVALIRRRLAAARQHSHCASQARKELGFPSPFVLMTVRKYARRCFSLSTLAEKASALHLAFARRAFHKPCRTKAVNQPVPSLDSPLIQLAAAVNKVLMSSTAFLLSQCFLAEVSFFEDFCKDGGKKNFSLLFFFPASA